MEHSMSEEFIQSRELTAGERNLIRCLLAKADTSSVQRFELQGMRGILLSDGGMGSLRLISGNVIKPNRAFGSKASEIEFVDADGIPVSVALILDKDGEPFELDIFKADFSPVLSIPLNLDSPQ